MKMPVLFVGHGSPMNAIEKNEYTKKWAEIGSRYKPKAILAISGHWYTEGTKIMNTIRPKKINDMYGFPRDLYTLEYDLVGDEALTEKVMNLLGPSVEIDDSWGIDHGIWSILAHMYPKADVPVVQLSLNRALKPSDHIAIGRQLVDLRKEGYMIMASGNVVHNLGLINPSLEGGYPWAESFDNTIESYVVNKDSNGLMDYEALGDEARKSVPSAEHFLPLLYAVGASDNEDAIEIFNKSYDLGALSMTSYIFD